MWLLVIESIIFINFNLFSKLDTLFCRILANILINLPLPFLISGVCYFLSSVVNPFLYSLLSKRFRRGFFDLKNKLKTRCINFANRQSPSHERSSDNSRVAPENPMTRHTPHLNISLRPRSCITTQCFTTKQILTRSALRRHLALPLSFSSVNCEREKSTQPPYQSNEVFEMNELRRPNGITIPIKELQYRPNASASDNHPQVPTARVIHSTSIDGETNPLKSSPAQNKTVILYRKNTHVKKRTKSCNLESQVNYRYKVTFKRPKKNEVEIIHEAGLRFYSETEKKHKPKIFPRNLYFNLTSAV